MLKNRLIYLIMLLVLLLFRIAYTGYVAGMLLVMALILPMFSWIISLPGALYTRISLSVPDQVLRGGEISVYLSIRHSRLFSTGPVRGKLSAIDQASGAVTRAKLRRADTTFPLDTSHCCQYQCTLTHFRVYDLTGLLPMPTKKIPSVPVTVIPIPTEPPEHPDWSDSPSMVSRPYSGSSNPYELREYRVGDSIRSIHWKKSAALDKTVVRDSLEPAERVSTIWLDWPDDPAGRDLVLDQLAWCIIYLNQNNGALRLRWLDKDGIRQEIFKPQGEIETVTPQMLMQPPGQRANTALLHPGDILLSAGVGGEAAV